MKYIQRPVGTRNNSGSTGTPLQFGGWGWDYIKSNRKGKLIKSMEHWTVNIFLC